MEVALVENENPMKRTVHGSSAILLNKNYAICTLNAFTTLFDNDEEFFRFCDSITPGKLHTPNKINPLAKNIKARIIFKGSDNNRFTVKSLSPLALWSCDSIKYTSRRTLQDWAIDSQDITLHLTSILSIFLVFAIEPSSHIRDFESCLDFWWEQIKDAGLNQGDEIIVKSVPFATRTLINTYSKGIVSNTIGKNHCLILSDCPTALGSEGSPVFVKHSSIPVGIVLSSLCSWKRSWTGLTLIADARSILVELLSHYQHINELNKPTNYKVVATLESALVQVCCGSQWGTGILVDKTKGIFLTNSHVVDKSKEVKLHRKGNALRATIIYKVPENEAFDLAVLKCDLPSQEPWNLKSVTLSHKQIMQGDEVYCGGFALFPKDLQYGPSLSKGCISQITKSMIKTTCTVNPGMSGGPVLDDCGQLLGVIVCNTKFNDTDAVYPRFNMAIPYSAFEPLVEEYLSTGDYNKLDGLVTADASAALPWKQLNAKL